VLVGQAEAGAVDGVEKVKEGEVKLGGQVHQRQPGCRFVAARDGLLVCYRVGPPRRTERRPPCRCSRSFHLLLNWLR
jgi:hypothetical protein